MSTALHFDPIRLPPHCVELRKEVRAFLRQEIAAGTFDPHGNESGDMFNRAFSKKVGAKGWIGITWPKQYGGQERSFLERYVITEEFSAHNAPVRLHFTADRQSGPVLIKYASEALKSDILPRITRGECCFGIGMSEPNSGSDLFAASTKATKTDGGYLVNGTKVWTSNAHHAHYMIGLFRTSASTKENRRHGLTQFVVDMKTPFRVTIERNKGRLGGVPESVIRNMALQNCLFDAMRNIVIVDIDGTVADCTHRQHFVQNVQKKDWKGFFSQLYLDTPRKDVYEDACEVARENDAEIVFVSARPEDYREETEAWLKKNKMDYIALVMRRKGDSRPDTDVKRDIYNRYLKQYDVVKVFDDRPAVIRMWEAEGLDVEDVGNGEEF